MVRSPFFPVTRTTGSSAASATHISDGWVAIHCSLARNIDHTTRPRDVFLHQIKKICAAGDKLRSLVRGNFAHGGCHVVDSCVGKSIHRAAPALVRIACSIAATI